MTPLWDPSGNWPMPDNVMEGRVGRGCGLRLDRLGVCLKVEVWVLRDRGIPDVFEATCLEKTDNIGTG